MTARQRAAEASLRDQENFLPHKQLCLTFFCLSITLLVFFIDQNGIGQLLPTAARDLNATSTISWAGTSALIGNTVFSVLWGRLSDLFGRKGVYLSALGLLCFSDLMCGISRNAPMLYFFRGLTGVAGGGITSLTMMIVSDIVSLERRGKYQGILGSQVGLGNLIGPIIAAAFTSTTVSWRGLFYLLAPLAAVALVIQWRVLPSSMPKGEFKASFKKIDYWGTITLTIALICLLVPISGGGLYFEWDSPMVIAMLTIGGIFAVIFVIIEWKVASLPMLPLTLFKNPAVAAIMVQNFFFGLVFYTYMYYLPLYYQNVRRLTPLHSALLTIPMTATQAVASTLSGQYISRRKRYGEVIWLGFILFTVGVSLTTLFDENIQTSYIVGILIVLGYGNGNVFQPTIVALQAHCYKSQRAVVISVRNFLRALGGSFGLVMAAAMLQATLKSALPEEYKYLAHSTYARPDYDTIDPQDAALIMAAYAKASRSVFILLSPFAGLCLLTCLFVRDRGLTRPDEVPAVSQAQVVPVITDNKDSAVVGVKISEEVRDEKEVDISDAEKHSEDGTDLESLGRQSR